MSIDQLKIKKKAPDRHQRSCNTRESIKTNPMTTPTDPFSEHYPSAPLSDDDDDDDGGLLRVSRLCNALGKHALDVTRISYQRR